MSLAALAVAGAALVGPPAPAAAVAPEHFDGFRFHVEPREVRAGRIRAAYLAAGAADLLATEVALAHGAREGNPLLQNRAVRVGAVLAGAALVAELDVALGRRGQRRAQHAARAAYFTVSGVKVALGLRFVW